MKFFVAGSLEKNRPLKTGLGLFFLFGLLFLASYGYVEAGQTGLTPSVLKLNLLGDEALFLEPMELPRLVEFLHVRLFLFLILGVMTAATLLALENFAAAGLRWGLLLFGLLFLDVAALFAARYGPECCIYAKAATGWALYGVYALAQLAALRKLLR